MNFVSDTTKSELLRDRLSKFITKYAGHILLQKEPEASRGCIPTERVKEYEAFFSGLFGLFLTAGGIILFFLGSSFARLIMVSLFMGLGFTITIWPLNSHLVRKWHPLNAAQRGYLSMTEIPLHDRGNYILMIENALIITEDLILYNYGSICNAPVFYKRGHAEHRVGFGAAGDQFNLFYHRIEDILESEEPITLDPKQIDAKWNWGTLITAENQPLLLELAQIFNELQTTIKEKEANAQKAFDQRREELLSHYDSDGNGKLDLVESDKQFEQILSINESKIAGIDRKYLRQFVQIGSHLEGIKLELQALFTKLENAKSPQKLERINSILEEEIHNYNLLQLTALAMITCLVESKMIDFYKIYEAFDELGLFETQFERNVLNRLDQLEQRFEQMSTILHNKLSSLQSISEANNNAMQKQLESVNSSLKVNNLLTAVNTYKTYRIGKNLNN